MVFLNAEVCKKVIPTRTKLPNRPFELPPINSVILKYGNTAFEYYSLNTTMLQYKQMCKLRLVPNVAAFWLNKTCLGVITYVFSFIFWFLSNVWTIRHIGKGFLLSTVIELNRVFR